MSLATVSDLSLALRADLAWRRKELIFFEATVKNAVLGKRQPLLRGAVACLYAHWEGYVKLACRTYVEFVRIRKLCHDELATPFLVFAIRSKAADAMKLPNASLAEFLETFQSEWGRRAYIPKPEKIIATSNLSAHVFRDMVTSVGVTYLPAFALAEKPLIDALVDLRNGLAHGEWQIVDENVYFEFKKRIDFLMVTLCDEIENAASQNRYRR